MPLLDDSVFPRTLVDRSVVVSSPIEKDSLVPIVLNSSRSSCSIVLYQVKVSTVVAEVPFRIGSSGIVQ